MVVCRSKYVRKGNEGTGSVGTGLGDNVPDARKFSLIRR